jgi:PadR family transcriptional regulator, regulatory protein PadR
MNAEPKMTMTTLSVLRLMLDDPTHEYYGWELCQAAGLQSGTVYPILARLEKAGWLTSAKEVTDAAEQPQRRHPRRPRRFYRLTTDGAERARVALAEAQQALRSKVDPAPAPGFLRPGGAPA